METGSQAPIPSIASGQAILDLVDTGRSHEDGGWKELEEEGFLENHTSMCGMLVSSGL